MEGRGMTTAEILETELNSLKQDLIRKHIELGMKASGQWEEELEVVVIQTNAGISGALKGEDYTVQLSEGRAPGKFPPLEDIEAWVESKGLAAIDNEISTSSLAYLIARKIAREGTEYYKQGGTDLIESVVTPERIQSIIDKVREVNVGVFVENLLDQIRTLEVA